MRYITAILFASLAAGLIVAYAYPTYQDIGTLKAREVVLQDYIKNASVAQEKINDLEAKYQRFPEGASERMSTMIPDSIDDVRLTMDLTNLAAQHGLSLANPAIKKLAVDKNSQLQQYSVAFSIEAPYATFRSFLDDIEYWLQIRDITELTITPGDTASAPMKVSFNFVTYALH
jgi:F0F1-type ATP synthase membrane subunit b/b'